MNETNNITILFVDDEPEVLSSLRRFLRKEPYQMLFASGGDEALEVIEKHRPQLLVTDLRMPGMGGLELISRVKEEYPDMLRLVLSATRDIEETINSINTGEIFRFISKPLEPDSFRRTLLEAVDYYCIKAERARLVTELAETNSHLKSTIDNLTEANREKEILQQQALETDRKIEEQLLKSPLPEKLKGVSLGVISIPSSHLDGDFFDFYPFSESCFDIVIGDVMGKGLQSGLVGAGMKQIILKALAGYRCQYDKQRCGQAGCNSDRSDLAVVFSEIHDKSIQKLVDLEMYLSLCYARLNIADKTLDFIDCGHPKTIHYSSEKRSTSFLSGINLPLGFAEEADYQPTRVQLLPGDILLFYTDGIIEAEDEAAQFYSPDKLALFVESHSDLSAAQLVEAVEEDVRKHTGRELFSDDFTCIAIKLDQSES